jgi:hypothetical protein
MKSFLKALLLVPIAAVAVLFAVGNRTPATIDLDPLGILAPSWPVTMPLFLLIFLALAVGVILGGVAVWFGQSRHRRAARANARELARHREELERVRVKAGEVPSLPHASSIR